MANVYFDSCCFIDLIKQIAGILPTDRANDVWYCNKLLEASQKADAKVFTSFMTFAECTHAKDENDQKIITEDVRKAIDGFFFSVRAGVTPVQPSIFVLERIRSLTWDDGIFLKGFDALHVGSALVAECSEFITTDDRISDDAKAVLLDKHHLTVCSAPQTVALPPHYLQQNLDHGHKAAE